jgi:hypothetical protein
MTSNQFCTKFGTLQGFEYIKKYIIKTKAIRSDSAVAQRHSAARPVCTVWAQCWDLRTAWWPDCISGIGQQALRWWPFTAGTPTQWRTGRGLTCGRTVDDYDFSQGRRRSTASGSGVRCSDEYGKEDGGTQWLAFWRPETCATEKRKVRHGRHGKKRRRWALTGGSGVVVFGQTLSTRTSFIPDTAMTGGCRPHRPIRVRRLATQPLTGEPHVTAKNGFKINPKSAFSRKKNR